ncbi:MAG TPA: flavodoxin family protein [Anaerolineales bacterium]|nr:flavodoxin family protein [Anaerolineales bacterium]
MKALVVYDSVFGNTQKIAEAIAASLGARAETSLLRPSEADLSRFAGLDLLVVGSPTRGFRPTEAMADLLKSLPAKLLKGVRVAAFDTRFNADEMDSGVARFVVRTGGFAAKRIADRLKRAGGLAAAPPEGFFVKDTEGPLKPGELERAASWAGSLLPIPDPSKPEEGAS